MAADNLNIQISARTKEAIDHINELIGALSDLNSNLGIINTSGLDSVTGALNEMNGAISSIQGTVNTVSSLNRELADTGRAVAPMESAANSLQEVDNAGRSAANSVREISAATNGEATSGLQSMAQAAENTNQALQRVAPSADRAARSMRSMGGSSIGAALSSKGLVKELTRIGKMLKLMVTRMVLRKVIQGVLDGFKNLVQYSKTFDASVSLLWNSFRQLGNSIAAAVSPLINALAPALNYVIQLIIKAINVINQLISALMGLGTWTRAKTLTDDYAKSLDKANGSAKALKKTVLGFDELNQLQDNSGGGGGSSAADMFEQVAIDPKILKFLEDLKNMASNIAAKFKELWKNFKQGFKDALGSNWKDKVKSILDGATRIQQAMQRIFNDPRVTQARDKFANSIATTLGKVAGSTARIGLNIGVNLSQGIADALEDKEPEIKDFLVNMFDIGTSISDKVGEFSEAIGEISDVLAGDNAIAATSEAFSVMSESIMLVTENTGKLTESLTELMANPIIENVTGISDALDHLLSNVAGFEEAIDTILQGLRDTFSSLWDDSLSPIFDDITEGFSKVTGSLLEFWNQYISPFIDDLAAGIKEMWQTDLGPFFDDLLHILGIVGEALTKLWKSMIVPLFSFLTNFFGPQIRAGLTLLWNSIQAVVKSISLIIGTITSVLRALLTFFKTGFTQGWTTAWKNLGRDFAQIWENMKTKMTSIINVMIDSINALLGAITGLVDNVSRKINELAGTSIPLLSEKIKIPHLSSFATGGFPEDGLFMANHGEMVGRFSNGRTAVANNEQITAGIAQAVYSAMMASNGGGSQYINNTIEIDGVAIARAVTKGQRSLDRRYSPTMA